MKIAAQCDWFIEKYGPEGGVRYLKELGFENLVLTINGRYDQPFTTSWTDRDLEENYAPVRKAARGSSLNMLFAVLGTNIYLDDLAHTADARRKMCVQAVKAAAYAGCAFLGVRPAVLVQSSPDAPEKSKEITCSIFDEMQAAAKQTGIRLAFINGTKTLGCSYGNRCYGSSSRDLLELAERYDGKILIDPISAEFANEKAEELIEAAGERLLGILVTDMECSTRLPVIPTAGHINYVSITQALRHVCDDAALVTMYTPVFKRYKDLLQTEGLADELSRLLLRVTKVFAERGTGREGGRS